MNACLIFQLLYLVWFLLRCAACLDIIQVYIFVVVDTSHAQHSSSLALPLINQTLPLACLDLTTLVPTPYRYDDLKGHKRSTTQPPRQAGSKSPQGVISPLKSSKVYSHTSSNTVTNASSGALTGKRHVPRHMSSTTGTTGKRLVKSNKMITIFVLFSQVSHLLCSANWWYIQRVLSEKDITHKLFNIQTIKMLSNSTMPPAVELFIAGVLNSYWQYIYLAFLIMTTIPYQLVTWQVFFY